MLNVPIPQWVPTPAEATAIDQTGALVAVMAITLIFYAASLYGLLVIAGYVRLAAEDIKAIRDLLNGGRDA